MSIRKPSPSIDARMASPKSTSYVAFWNGYSPGAICSGAATHFIPSSTSTLTPASAVSTVTSTSLSGIVNVYTDVLPALAASSLTMFTSAAVTNVTIFHDGTTTLTVIVVPADADAALVVTSTSSGASTEILWAMLPPSPPSPPPGCVPSSPHAARQKDSASTAATATSAVMSFLFIEIPSSQAFYALTAIVSRDMPFVNAARHKFFSPLQNRLQNSHFWQLP